MKRREFFGLLGSAAAWPLAARAQKAVRKPQDVGNLSVLNFKDFGAIGDGVTNNNLAIVAFNTWARTQKEAVHLWIPPGRYKGGGLICEGIKKLIVSAHGAFWDGDFWIGAAGIGLGSGIWVDDAHSPRVETVAAGSQSARLIDPSKASLFSPGQWVLITALDLMGLGYPPNPYYNEFIQISSVGAIGNPGLISFRTPLRNGYKSTFPCYLPHGAKYTSPVDQAGPATIYSLQDVWDTDVTIQGMHFGDTYLGRCDGRKISLIDCIFDNYNPAPSVCKHFSAERCQFAKAGKEIELDKIIETAFFRDCTSVASLTVQSSSVDRLIVDGCFFGSVNAGARNNIIRNSAIGALIFGTRFGRVETVAIENCRINIVDNFSQHNPMSDFTVSHGTLKIAKSKGPVLWAVPGQNCYVGDSHTNWGGPFTVIDVREDGDYTYVDTTLAGNAFPVIPAATGPQRSPGAVFHRFDPATEIASHGAANVSVKNCVGCPEIVDMCHLDGAPIYSYSRRIYSGNWGTSAPAFTQWGKLVKITVNVIRAYTGSAPLCRMVVGGTYGIEAVNPDHTYHQYRPLINLKYAGIRTIVPGSGGISGAQIGDSMPEVGAIWLRTSCNGTLADDIGGDPRDKWPIVEVIVETDQGIMNGPFHVGADTLP